MSTIEILKRGSTWIAIDKPSGIPTQAPSEFPSAESILANQLKTSTGSGADSGLGYLAMPHRLDTPVSGVLLVALTKKSARLLSEQFASRKVSKTYQAIVAGDARSIDQQWEDHIIKRSGQAKAELSTSPDSKVARTIVERVDYDESSHRSRLILRPVTGRMHQLRIGAASRGFPILGDDVYGVGTTTQSRNTSISLRAVAIEFRSPENGAVTRVKAKPLPWPVPCG